MLWMRCADLQWGQFQSKEVVGQPYVPEGLQEQVCEKLKGLKHGMQTLHQFLWNSFDWLICPSLRREGMRQQNMRIPSIISCRRV